MRPLWCLNHYSGRSQTDDEEPEFCSDECSLNFNRPLSELARREAAIRLSGAWIAA
jgi:hypothetical protein